MRSSVTTGQEIIRGDVPYRDLPKGVSEYAGAETDERLVELWLHGKGVNTKKAYVSDLTRFLAFVEGKPLRAITLADLQDFSDFLSELPIALATRARTLASVKSLLSFGHRVGYLPFDVGKAVKLPAIRDERAEPRSDRPGAQEAVQIPWWRRMFGV